MQPLEQLLDRIKWDPAFGSGAFTAAYYDRVLDRELIVPLASLTDDEDAPIPLHRVRAVYRDGIEIWRRPERIAGKERP